TLKEQLEMRYHLLLATVAVALGAAACTDSTSGGSGKMTVQMTDAPFPFSQVSRVDMFVVRIDAKSGTTDDTEVANTTSMSGWTTIATPNTTINLLSLQGGVTTNLGTTSLATGTYKG